MIEVDARGLSCPIPVVRTKEAIDQKPDMPLVVLVDNEVSKENVSRLARSRGYSVEVETAEDGFRLLLSPLAK
jgi:tRNA 2-thiouridine synthesizing protein A